MVWIDLRQLSIGKPKQTVAIDAWHRHTGVMAEKDQNKDEKQPAPEIEPRFYTIEQTAQYLNVSVQQVYSLVRSGDLPGIKIGGRGVWRVGKEHLEEYVERVLAETAAWTKTHPLGAKDDGSQGESTS